MKYYAYYRISTDKQEFLRQKSIIKDYCDKNEIALSAEYQDTITGKYKAETRDEWKALKKVVSSGDAVIFADYTRLGRDFDDLNAEITEFFQKNVRVIIASDELLTKLFEARVKPDATLIDKFSAMLMQLVQSYISEVERVNLSNRTKQALKAKKEQGIVLGRRYDGDYDADYKKIKKMWQSGLTVQHISNIIGYDRSKIYRILRQIQKDAEINGESIRAFTR